MKRLALALVLCASAAYAGDVEVSLGQRTELHSSRKAIHEIDVRDPELLRVVTTNGVVSLEGLKSGVTSVTVTYADGEIERILVVVGSGTNSKGPRMQQSQKVDLKAMGTATAQTKEAAPEPKGKETKRESVREAKEAVRAAVESL
jgi:hypothetical protein